MSDIWNRAKNVLPGGVNSPVRAFGSVGGEPVFMKSAKGAEIIDTQGNIYVDFVGSWGPMILGHSDSRVVEATQHALANGASFGACCELEVEMAELVISRVPSLEMVRMVNSGTEATMSVVRVARGVTKREKIIKFRGCFHGHADAFLIEAGSGMVTHGEPNSAGVTRGAAQDTLLADYNDLDSVSELFKANADEVACIIVEPVAGNMGLVPPRPGFLEGLRKLCDAHGALLIFDEVMTGFRLSPAGAEGLYGVTPDLAAFGKIIGGGLPVGGYGGKKEFMMQISPLGPIYQSGTLSGNPLAMAAGIATLTALGEEGFYEALEAKSIAFTDSILEGVKDLSIDIQIQQVGSMFTIFFQDKPINNFADACQGDDSVYAQFFQGLLKKGIYIAPSAYEAWFMSAAHTETQLNKASKAIIEVLTEMSK